MESKAVFAILNQSVGGEVGFFGALSTSGVFIVFLGIFSAVGALSSQKIRFFRKISKNISEFSTNFIKFQKWAFLVKKTPNLTKIAATSSF